MRGDLLQKQRRVLLALACGCRVEDALLQDLARLGLVAGQTLTEDGARHVAELLTTGPALPELRAAGRALLERMAPRVGINRDRCRGRTAPTLRHLPRGVRCSSREPRRAPRCAPALVPRCLTSGILEALTGHNMDWIEDRMVRSTVAATACITTAAGLLGRSPRTIYTVLAREEKSDVVHGHP